jgi:hypothetical protein
MRKASIGVALAVITACSEGTHRRACSKGAVTITTREVWHALECTIADTLTVENGGELVLEDTVIRFAPEVEDTDAFVVRGDGRVHADHSRLESGSGLQWNLQAYDDAVIELVHTPATDHSGLRNYDRAQFIASSADVEEVQVHDDARVRMDRGAAGYMVLFFTGGVAATYGEGELVIGEGQRRTLAVPTGPSTAGTLELDDADIYGWQLDLENDSQIAIAGGEEIVLALHLTDVVATVADDVTTNGPSAGALDFFTQGGPGFTYTDSAIASFNLYAAGACDLSFTGNITVNEPNAEGTSKVAFGPDTTLFANLAQTYEQAEMSFTGVTLSVDGDDGSSPSFTADDTSIIRITDVKAIHDTYASAVGGGRVLIDGGSGWQEQTLEAVDPEGTGGVYLDGVRVAP